jgi:hypothetical protein
MLIAVKRVAVAHRYLGEPRLRVVTDRNNRNLRHSVKMLDHVVVVDVVGLIKDYNEGIFDGVSEEFVDIVDRHVS